MGHSTFERISLGRECVRIMKDKATVETTDSFCTHICSLTTITTEYTTGWLSQLGLRCEQSTVMASSISVQDASQSLTLPDQQNI